ncbi:MAG: PQQ-binding-like beta-propeller repeat protein, partial [Halobacteriales archaeon]|nr:PQQ-binding-like beta-propeller repeat protein [Halobacteriales archaeon]
MVPTTRRRMLRRGLVCGVVGLTGCVSGPAGGGRATHVSDVDLPRSAAWPTYQYDTANTGYNPEASGPTGEVEIAWRYSAHTEAESGAIVSDGRVYAGSLIVDGQTGQRNGGNWGGHYSTPTVDEGTLYVGSHDLEAQDATTGTHRWTFETDEDAGALPATTVADGTVYVPGGIDDPTLYAIDAETGAERWRFEAGGDIGVPVAVVEGVVYTVDRRNTVYEIDGATGDERW